ncbi:hypothetical protein FA95DRAFT_1495407 [Auriscalpium vulgare]|uniref:Uncharacterized protein n=1 Tax=Auriscalpium vulgare TaxID=40419 RepID=A0ACB8RN26_9AGAM|nr:hypothetical protein FA95DRAFT_1495407 [Auriscalpium vulgare]
MGCSPYFAVTGCHPLIPLDITEATYLQPPPDSILSSTDLIARRAIALQKRHSDISALWSQVYETRLENARRFEEEHSHTIRDFDFKCGTLVLMRNTAIEKSLNHKMRPHYLSPLFIILRNRGGAYILADLDASVLDCPIAAFRVIAYFARCEPINIDIRAINIDTQRLRKLEQSETKGNEDEAEPPEDELRDAELPDDEPVAEQE